MNIICAGDFGTDNYIDLDLINPGGISLNVAVHIKRISSSSHNVGAVGVIGNDHEAEIVNSTLHQYGVVNYLEQMPGITPVQYIKNSEDGEKIFLKYEAGVIDNYELNDKQSLLISESDAVICPIFSQIGPLFNSVIKVKTNAIKVADFGSLDDYQKKMDIVKKYINEIDIAIFGLTTEDDVQLNQIEDLAKITDRLFVVTLGKDGSQAFQNNKKIHIPAVHVKKVVDSTGAGDAFTAAFLTSYLTHRSVSESLHAGNLYGAEIVQHIGSL